MTEYYSLKQRLGRNLLAYMLAVMILLLLASNFVIRSLVNDYVASRLEHDVETLVHALRQDEQGGWFLDPTRVSTVYQRVRSGHYFVIRTPDGWLHSRSLFDMDPKQLTTRGLERFEMAGPGQEYWLVIHRKVVKQGQSLQLWVAEDVHEVHDRLRQWLVYLGLLLVAVTLALLWLQRGLLERSFAIFDRVQQALRQHRYQPLQLESTEIPREIGPLLDEIALLLEHLRKRIQRTRNAIGDLAHELKRPLQVLALSRPEGEERQAVLQIGRVIERELKRARISGHEAVGSAFDPGQDIPLLIDLLKRVYPEVEIETDIRVEGRLALDRDDLLELVGNLLDNAAKFARSRVRLELALWDGKLQLVIEDDGPGLPSDQAQRVTRKGVRLDETREGHGLGLRICADIVDSYGGRMDFETSCRGGLKLVLSLPVAGYPEQGPGSSEAVCPDCR